MKRTSLLLLVLTGMLLVSLLVGSCGGTAVSSPTSPSTQTVSATPTTTKPPAVNAIELKLSVQGPTTDVAAQSGWDYVAAQVENKTQGRVKIKIFNSSVLAAPPQAFDAAVKGVADIVECTAGYTPGRFPASEISDLPIGFPNSLVISRSFNDWYDKFKPKEWDEVVMLSLVGTPPPVLGTVGQPVRKLEDMKGLITKISSARQGSIIQDLGGVPRSMSISDTYEALSKAQLNAIAIGMDTYLSFHFGDVIKYSTDISAIGFCSMIATVMNKDSWNKLQPNDQKVLATAFREAVDVRAKAQDGGAVAALKQFQSLPGREYIKLDPSEVTRFKNATSSVINDYITDMTAKGLAGADYTKYMQERVDYWSKAQ